MKDLSIEDYRAASVKTRKAEKPCGRCGGMTRYKSGGCNKCEQKRATERLFGHTEESTKLAKKRRLAIEAHQARAIAPKDDYDFDF